MYKSNHHWVLSWLTIAIPMHGSGPQNFFLAIEGLGDAHKLLNGVFRALKKIDYTMIDLVVGTGCDIVFVGIK